MKKLIYPYYQNFPIIFKKEKDKISKKIKNIEIHHIGSTSIPGLGGKGIIDIMIGIKNWKELESIVKGLKTMSFKHIHPKEQGRVFLSKIGQTKLGDIHIHIVIIGKKPYKELIIFRDYLRKNKKEVKRFFKLKQEWSGKAKEGRIKYGMLKTEYVKEILKKVR